MVSSLDKRRMRAIRRGELKRETESLIIAAQDQAIRTNQIKAKMMMMMNFI